MTQLAADVLAQALCLPEQERGDVATRLIESLDSVTDADAETAWSEEIQKRIDELRSGAVKPLTWEKARGQIMDESDEPDAP